MRKIPDPQVFRAAADVIRENGWNQGDYYRPVEGVAPDKCPVCILGAVRVVAADGVENVSDASVAATAWLTDLHLRVNPSARHEYVDEWNDQEGRDVADVLGFLEYAASEAEAARAAQNGGTA